ncbi:Tfp pilus assembly protein PilN [Desulfocicer vacuolatum DSM 3385]|uniref:Tfp pilus assembly protein PilN n=1 Tax=Desulfocicer vacuolatum DSM 3385 TaxID=1121400 RepID=A0A1W1ZF53_9BACT|nr:PilN domain-containing protein [Desulfocicer vacuolatum]SMC47165.1 Tfp pilus assembly protein PilN [Desulfocicer vacuolatum DSM 3385]
MNGHLLALEIKDTPCPDSADIIPKGTGGQHAEKGAATPFSWTLSALILKPTVKGLVILNATTLYMQPLVEKKNGDRDGESALDEVLDRLAQKMDFSACSRVAVAIPAFLFFFRHMDLPFRSRWKIGQVLPMELDAALPLPDEPHTHDFISTGLSLSDDHIFLTASLSTTVVDVIYDGLGKRGMAPGLISSAGYLASHLFFSSLADRGFYLMVDVTSHCLVVNGILDRNIVGFRSLVMSPEQRDTHVAMDVSRTLMLFRHRLGITPPLLGCHIILPHVRGEEMDIVHGLKARLEKILDVPVVFEDATLVLPSPESQTLVLQPDAHDYVNAFAAAQCSGKQGYLNFCRNGNGQGAFVEKHMPQLITTGVLLLFCFVMAVAGQYMDIASLENKSAAMDRRAVTVLKRSFPEITTVVDPYMQMKIQMRQALEKSPGARNMQHRFVADTKITDLFFELSSRIPPTVDVEISRLVFNDGRMVISGNTDTYDSVDKMKTAMESSAFFIDVKISNAAADKNDKRIRFKFVFQTTNGRNDVSMVKKENS